MPTSSQPQRPWKATQPLRALCIAYFYLSTPPWAIYLMLKYSIFKSLRPAPALSLKTNVTNTITKTLFSILTVTRSPRFVAENPSAAKDRLVNVDVAPAPLYTGPIAATAAVKPVPQQAIWFPSAPAAGATPGADETVVLHLPGGAFISAVGHEAFGRKGADAWLTKADRFIWAQYRLASENGAGFPAAIQDAVTYYAWVLSLGYEPKNIIISGDSAGGNAAIALLRYLVSTQVLPLPRGVVTWSPWVEVTKHAGRDFSEQNTALTDILVPEFLQWGSDCYRPRGKVSAEVEAYLSPLGHPFETSVPLFLHAGEAEAFAPSIKKFTEQMKEVNGSDRIRYHGTPHAIHDLLLVWETQGMRKQANAAVADAWDLLGA